MWIPSPPVALQRSWPHTVTMKATSKLIAGIDLDSTKAQDSSSLGRWEESKGEDWVRATTWWGEALAISQPVHIYFSFWLNEVKEPPSSWQHQPHSSWLSSLISLQMLHCHQAAMGQHHAHQRGSAHFKRYSLVMAGGTTAPFVFTQESSNPGQTAPCCFELSTSRQLLSFPASVQPLQILSSSCAGTRGADRMPSRWRHPDIRTLHQGREVPRGDLSYPGGQIYTLSPAQAFYDSQPYS